MTSRVTVQLDHIKQAEKRPLDGIDNDIPPHEVSHALV